MTRRAAVLGTVFACLALPAVAVLIDAASHYAANRTTGTIAVAGEERPYIVHVPPGYDPSKKTALVISLHGAGMWPAAQMNVTQWNRVADAHGFIVAYPGGEGGALRVWTMRGDRNPARMPDVRFISDLIDKLQAGFNIDPARVYANGLSNGGGMSWVLSCTLSDRIAAVGLVGAALLMPFEWCRDPAPVPTIVIHGTGDRATPYDGGKVFIAPNAFPSIPQWTAKAAQRNGCDLVPGTTFVASGVERIEYRGCARDASVVLYRIEGGGHTWPGGLELPEWLLGRTPREIDASETMWAFFREHPRR